jgi:predicted ATPase
MKHGLETWRLWGQCFDGVLRIKRGASVDGSRLLSDALSGLPAGGLYLNRNLFAELAEGFGAAGQTAEGLTLINDAIARVERTEEEWCFAELLREKGELLLLRAAPSAVAEAEACFQRALDVARRQDALAWELRAATSLARLWHRQHRTSHGRKLLAAVYRRFTEGFETADLTAARALLATLQ